MPRRCKNRRGILDADNLILRRVHHQQRLMQMSEVMLKGLALGILNQPLADREGATSERHGSDAVPFDVVELCLEMVEHMGDIEGCADGHNRLRLWHAMCGGQHSSPA